MKSTEAIGKLREMQKQIVHGSNLFGEIADCMERMQEALGPFSRMADKFDVEPYRDNYPDELLLRANAVVTSHNWLTIGDCRRAKAALK